MRRRWLAAAVVVAALLLALAIQLPASLAPRLLSSQVPPLALSGVSGSLWQGRAVQTSWDRWPAGAVRWRVAIPPLLALRTRLELELEGPPLRGQLVLQRNLDGTLLISGAQITLPALWLQQIINQPALRLAGTVDLKIDRAMVDSEGWLVALDGSARWRDAVVSVDQRSALGDLLLSWTTDSNGRITGTLADEGGPLALAGEVSIANRAYRIRALASARSGDVALRRALSYLGRTEPSGEVRLEIFGPLVPLKPTSGT
ncbi:MAG: type II secretion system protein N [Pseudomonadota bacterium]